MPAARPSTASRARTRARAADAPKATPARASKPVPAAQGRGSTAQGKDPGTKRALGRGLASLIPPAAATTTSGTGYRTLGIERLVPNPKQPRKTFEETGLEELASSIRVQGLLQPILVRKLGDKYEIVAGERRWRAAMRAGLREVPTVVKELTDTHALQLALIENIQRRDLDAIEEAQAYQQLVQEHDLTHEELAEALGKSRANISNTMRLLRLPPQVSRLLAEGKLGAGHVRPLLALTDDKLIIKLAEDFARRKVTAREAEALAKRAGSAGKKDQAAERRAEPKADAAASAIADQLRGYLGAKVELHSRGKKGSIEIHFNSYDELDDLLDRIMTA
jgi:ParB family chromosome partitioning protein